MALNQGKKIERAAGGGLSTLAVAALAACFQGGLAMIAGGFARPARSGQGATDALRQADAASARVVGIFLDSVAGGIADGDARVTVQDGTYLFRNSAGADAITTADIGHYAFVVDDETVAKLSANRTRPRAGVIRDVEPRGVLVELGAEIAAAAPRSLFLPFSISQADLLAGIAAELVAPVGGHIVNLQVVVQAAVTTGGDVTVQAGATPVDGLACVVPNGAAKGTVFSDTPTVGHASRAVAPGQRIGIVPAAAFDGAGAINGVLEIVF